MSNFRFILLAFSKLSIQSIPMRSVLGTTAFSRASLTADLPFLQTKKRQWGLSISFKICVLLSLLIAMAWSSASSAEDREGIAQVAEQWLMAKYDSNGDSIISVDEISQKREKMFSYLTQFHLFEKYNSWFIPALLDIMYQWQQQGCTIVFTLNAPPCIC